MRLTPPKKVEKLQTALRTKAKQSPTYRFYALYDKVYREDVVQYAYRLCRANNGSPGVDGQTFAGIETYGEDRGWANWRKNSGRRNIIRRPCGGSIYRSRTANRGRWHSDDT